MAWDDRFEFTTGGNALQGSVEWTVCPSQKNGTIDGWVQLTMSLGRNFQTGRLVPSEARRLAEELLRAARVAEEEVDRG